MAFDPIEAENAFQAKAQPACEACGPSSTGSWTMVDDPIQLPNIGSDIVAMLCNRCGYIRLFQAERLLGTSMDI
jgi:hypothetical protein